MMLSKLQRFHSPVILQPIVRAPILHMHQESSNSKISSHDNGSMRSEVKDLYRNLIHLSKEWPTNLRPQIKNAFMKNKDVTDTEEIKKLIARGEYICREITATYYLRKYRAMKRRYYSEHSDKHLQDLFDSFK